MVGLALHVAPTIEPLTLTEVLDHLRQSSLTFADSLTATQTIDSGAHVVAAAYSLVGAAVDVLNSQVVVLLQSGTNGAGGTVDVKLQDSDDNLTYTDVTSGAFTQVTTANDNAVQELAYTGGKRYLRAVATVAVATCEFGVTIIEGSNAGADADYITALITVAREWAEGFQNRAYITQTWELWLEEFPGDDYIRLPLPPLQSVTSVTYYGTDDTEYTVDSDDYFVDTKSVLGRVVLAYGKVWPSATLRPANGVCVTFVAGYGDTASDVPRKTRQAMLLAIGTWYDKLRSEGKDVMASKDMKVPFGAEALLSLDRIVPA